MTIHDALAPSAISRSDAEVLVSSLLRRDRSWLFAHPEAALSEEEAHLYMHWLERRKAGEPISYIIEEQSFYGRSYFVDRRVLIPRPSTEGLIEVVKQTLQKPKNQTVEIDTDIVAHVTMFHPRTKAKTIVDIGTGSGCIAITLACELPDYRIIATDISREAIDVAEMNAAWHEQGGRIEFLLGDGLGPIKHLKEPFLIVSNPPYIPSDHVLPRDVMHYEPHEALFSGTDGADLVRRMVKEAATLRFCVGCVIECRADQAASL